MKKIILMILTVFCLLLPMGVSADTKTDVQTIVNFMKSDIAKALKDNLEYVETDEEYQIIKDWSLFQKVQLAKLEDWRWVEHFVYYREVYYKASKTTFKQITMVVKERYNCLSPDSHTYMLWIITDPGADGKIHRVMRDWIIVMENYKNNDVNIKLIPQLPPEIHSFMKKIWTPSDAEGQMKYELELSRWLYQIKKWSK